MIIIALGSNLPGRFESCDAVLAAALSQIKTHFKIIAAARTYLTAPVPASDQPWYHNTVVAIETDQSPHDVLNILRGIETSMGRVRSIPNAARIIDLDIIAYNDAVIDTPDLTLPHPRMDARAFVLKPLNDIAPDWTHPITKKSVKILLAALPQKQWFADKPLYLMGIVNATPDSFSDGGAYDPITHARQLINEGADIIEIGGESTRPGSDIINPAAEQSRVLPVIMSLQNTFISNDTRNASTMRAALNAGAHMINDITALTHDPESMDVAATFDGPVCLMHMQGNPQTMQKAPRYDDVVGEIFTWLENRIAACLAAGIERGRLIADPGFGFGKTVDHNLALLDGFDRFQALGVTLMAGLSRKRFLGGDVVNRLEASLKAAHTAHQKGARILRVHDVLAHKQIFS